MNFNRIALACTLIVSSAGCAADPGKNVNAAEAELSGEQQKARSAEEDTNAEAKSEQESEEASAAATKNDATTDEKTNVAVSQADLAQDRRDFDAKTKERLAKIDAKAKELTTKSSKLVGKKATDFRAELTTFNSQRGDAGTKVAGLESTSNEGWSSAKANVEKSLETLDGALGRMEKDL